MKASMRSKTGCGPARSRSCQSGATLAEFAIIAPVVMFIGMTTVQAGLIYHGKTTLN